MHYLNSPTYKLITLLSFLLFVLVNCIDYSGFFANQSTDYSMTYRGIGSTFHLYFFGKMGILFNPKNGFLNILILPVLINYIIRFTYLKKGIQLLIVAIVSVALLIMTMGFFNYRYSITLLPIITAIIIIEYASAFPSMLRLKTLLMIGLSAFLLLLIILTGKLMNNHQEPIEGKVSYLFIQIINRMKGTDDIKSNHAFFLLSDSLAKSDNKRLMVNNIPQYYFHAKARALYYWCGDDILYMQDGKKHLFNNNSPECVRKNLQNFNIGYIISTEEYNKYSPLFNAFLKSHSTKISCSAKGYILYKIKT